MLKFIVACCSFFLFRADGSAAATNSLRPFRFAQVKRFKEIEGLPPKLWVTFDLMCNEKFLKVIRHDETDPKNGRTTIAVGVLVEENLLSSCAGVSKEMEVFGGKTFSGREYSISPIKK